MQSVIDLTGLTVRFGQRVVLEDLRATLSGRTIGLLGPNGAGKSTLIQALLGFCPVSSGSASIFGFDILKQSEVVRTIVGYMPENDAFVAEMTAVDFVSMMGEISGLPRDVALERAHEVLFYVGLGEARYRELGSYSLGMKQLAKLAQAIVHGPRLLILDEPTNGLDPPGRLRMLRLIREMRASGEMTLILCSHLLRDVEETCDEVLILKQGRIVHHADLAVERSGNKRVVDLQTFGRDEIFTASLTNRGCEIAATANGKFKISLPTGFEVSEIYRLAAASDLQLRHLSFRSDTLEDIFLKAMET